MDRPGPFVDNLAGRAPPLFDDLQCNILAPHRRKFSAHLFIALPRDDAVTYVKSWADKSTGVSRMSEVHRPELLRREELRAWQAKVKKNSSALGHTKLFFSNPKLFLHQVFFDESLKFLGRPRAHRNLVRSFMLSGTGVSRLGRLSDIPGSESVFTQGGPDTEQAFYPPPARSADAVRDWHPLFRDAKIDAQLLLASDDVDELLEAAVFETQRLNQAGGTVLGMCHGYVQKNKQQRAIEHFGYADGIGQPLFLQSDLSHEDYVQQQNQAQVLSRHMLPLRNALFQLPAGGFGSFQVFRQIEQHVEAFAGLPARDELIGRNQAGQPLDGAPATGLNDFEYTKESKCPFHAHIRKANPRTPQADALSEERRAVRFPRRGLLYGKREFNPVTGAFVGLPKKGDEVGLLFMAYMGSLVRQFMVMQGDWMSNASFPTEVPPPGKDPVLGLPPPTPPLTTVRGCEFFFVPPISWLQNL